MGKELKHVNFDSMISGIRDGFAQFPDPRERKQIRYSIDDIAMSAFACMYFQEPSLLAFQERMQEESQNNNLRTMFGVSGIAESTQLRNVLDVVDPDNYRRIFKNLISRLQRGKHLEQYQFLNGSYLVSGDGTQFTCSSNINCDRCLEAEHSNGAISYSHKAFQMSIMHPSIKQVIPLHAEEIANTDGTTKQDCEINAGKRAIGKVRQDHPQLRLTFVGDGLFSKQPFIQTLSDNRFDYILVAQTSDHKALFEYVKFSSEVQELTHKPKPTLQCYYRWLNDVPLSGREDALNVNYLCCESIYFDNNGNEKSRTTNAWVTNLKVTANNVIDLTRAGRCRWKIENECFNTLKNQGYHLEHNYGHGERYLCFNFYLLTLLAFFVHQILELVDELYQTCRKKVGAKQKFWHMVTSLINILLFDSWKALMQFVLDPKAFSMERIKALPA